MTKIEGKNTAGKIFNIFLQQEKPSALKTEHSALKK
jgi:hypothetical protein